MSDLEGVLAAAVDVEGFCRSQGWRFCFIGGVAVQRWGMPRFTQDVDLTLLARLGEEEGFVDTLLAKYAGRLRDTRKFALERRVVLLKTASGVNVDIALGAFPYEERSIDRATPWSLVNQMTITTCTAEDLVVHKVFAGRDRDWSDVETVLLRQRGQLSLDFVRRELLPLLELKEDTESMTKLERMITLVEKRAQS
jgi:hypothetical protein